MKMTSEWIEVPELVYFGMIAITILLLAISIFGIILYKKRERTQKKRCCYGILMVSLVFLLLISSGKITADTTHGDTTSQKEISKELTIIEIYQK